MSILSAEEALAVARLFAKPPAHDLFIEDSNGENSETWKASSSKMEGPKKGSNWRAMLTALDIRTIREVN
jgi:hypothetical protein